MSSWCDSLHANTIATDSSFRCISYEYVFSSVAFSADRWTREHAGIGARINGQNPSSMLMLNSSYPQAASRPWDSICRTLVTSKLVLLFRWVCRCSPKHLLLCRSSYIESKRVIFKPVKQNALRVRDLQSLMQWIVLFVCWWWLIRGAI